MPIARKPLPSGTHNDQLTERTCDGARTCWRIGDAEERTIDVSHDDGRTWDTDFQADGDEVEAELPCTRSRLPGHRRGRSEVGAS